MIKFKQVSLQLMSAFLLGMLAFSASAQAMPEPQALVKEASDNMLKALKDNLYAGTGYPVSTFRFRAYGQIGIRSKLA